jgi:hypothetical protein
MGHPSRTKDLGGEIKSPELPNLTRCACWRAFFRIFSVVLGAYFYSPAVLADRSQQAGMAFHDGQELRRVR